MISSFEAERFIKEVVNVLKGVSIITLNELSTVFKKYNIGVDNNIVVLSKGITPKYLEVFESQVREIFIKKEWNKLTTNESWFIVEIYSRYKYRDVIVRRCSDNKEWKAVEMYLHQAFNKLIDLIESEKD